ncbi:hypothetical protein [Limibacterium fermenti]|uniref:hypothetical protein n=1 Tax=Limibacterium fermenti TaxID=3229863 RepID=UPI003A60F480
MPYYLKCNHCGHLNEMNSPYSVLCSSCGKKMDNNFTEWQRRNPGKSFEDYKNAVCITESQFPPEVPKKKTRTLRYRSLKEKIWIVVTTTICALVGGWLGSSAVDALKNNKKSSTKIMKQEWVKQSMGNEWLTFEAPWRLVKSPDEGLPESLEAMVESMEIYENSDNEAITLTGTTIIYKPGIDFNLLGAAEGSANGLKSQPGITDFVYDVEMYSVESVSGYRLSGSFKMNGLDVDFFGVGLTQGVTYWTLIGLVKGNDKEGEKILRRIIESIDIK